jgi:hypothetical protein
MTTNPVLTVQSTATCGHGGTITLTSAAKLRVNGQGVLRVSDIEGKHFDCPGPNDPSHGFKQCQSVVAVTDNPPGKLAVAGVPVVRDTVTATTDGLMPPPALQPLPVKVVAGQAVLLSGTKGQP